MSPPANRPRLTTRDRLFAWLVTGPLGRIGAFFGDLGAYWWRRLRERRDRANGR